MRDCEDCPWWMPSYGCSTLGDCMRPRMRKTLRWPAGEGCRIPEAKLQAEWDAALARAKTEEE